MSQSTHTVGMTARDGNQKRDSGKRARKKGNPKPSNNISTELGPNQDKKPSKRRLPPRKADQINQARPPLPSHSEQGETIGKRIPPGAHFREFLV